MKSRIVHGRLFHSRVQPVGHAFEYPVYFFKIELDELPGLAQKNPFFSLNGWNIFSLREKDYLHPGQDNLREKVLSLLRSQGITEEPASIQLVTQLRYFGWVFNPVSFFFCRDRDGGLMSVIADVNNTFGEGHAYLLKDLKQTAQGSLEARALKVFHVSPFFERRGEYRFEFFFLPEETRIVLDYWEGASLLIATSWTGADRLWSVSGLLATMAQYPFAGWMTMFRIHFQAALLYFFKKLPVFKKPEPDHPMTLRKCT